MYQTFPLVDTDHTPFEVSINPV